MELTSISKRLNCVKYVCNLYWQYFYSDIPVGCIYPYIEIVKICIKMHTLPCTCTVQYHQWFSNWDTRAICGTLTKKLWHLAFIWTWLLWRKDIKRMTLRQTTSGQKSRSLYNCTLFRTQVVRYRFQLVLKLFAYIEAINKLCALSRNFLTCPGNTTKFINSNDLICTIVPVRILTFVGLVYVQQTDIALHKDINVQSIVFDINLKRLTY